MTKDGYCEIDEFVKRLFENSKNYWISKTSIEELYKRISENYKDDIEILKKRKKKNL